MNRYQFELLSYLEKNGDKEYTVRRISDDLCISGTEIIRCIDEAAAECLLKNDGGLLSVTDKGLAALEPYRVKRAIILAAGFGSRMMPATADRPKPMVTINGTRIIDTLLDALVGVGITEIVIIGGYRFEKLSELLDKYQSLQLIENKDYTTTNNISSAMLSLNHLHGGCYFCEADLYISNPGIITKYQYASNILGSYSMETDDWSFKMEDGCLTNYKKGNTYCYNYYGISYWTPDDCEKLKEDFTKVYIEYEGGRDFFWEFIPFVLMKDRYKVEIRPCRKQDIMEIDNYFELQQLDSGYR